MKRAGRPHIIFVTGDIANSGQASEYDQASNFFDKLLDTCFLTRRDLIVVPGNHDVDRTKGRWLHRTLHSREDSDEYFGQEQPLPHIADRQRNYADWFNSYFTEIRTFPENSACSAPEILKAGGANIQISTINSAIFCIDDTDSGNLWIGRRCVDAMSNALEGTSADLRICAMHHPLGWTSSVELPNIKSALRSTFDLVLSGHLHDNDAEHIAGVNGTALHLAAGATYQTRKYPNTAMFGGFREDSITILPISFSDSPTPVWSVDTSVYPESPNFERSYNIRGGAEISLGEIVNTFAAESAVERPTALIATESSEANTRATFEHDLFVTPTGEFLYAEPRLMDRPQSLNLDAEGDAKRIEILQIIEDGNSYLIDSRAEYGSSTLCKRLAHEFHLSNIPYVYRRDARSLPNYRKKLESSFPVEAQTNGGKSILILDNFDTERDEKLVRELEATDWFRKVIIVSVNRSLPSSRSTAFESKKFDLKYISLWGISRAEVRSMSARLFQSSDQSFVSNVVDKVYKDLLGLCIPLTPPNVIMYLRVLHREGDFHPLNRVDIVGRYLTETLRRPSDAYKGTFNSKNKLDFLSCFVFDLYKTGRGEFDDRTWHNFASKYQKDTLSEFDSAEFLDELLDSRVVYRSNSVLFLKYNFFFSYFLGRYIYAKPDLLRTFIKDEEHLSVSGVIDVITGLSSDNEETVRALCDRLETHLSDFSAKYVKSDLDPLSGAIWPDSNKDEEEIWKPIAAQIEAGPRSSEEIDIIKSSLTSEARTTDQKVVFDKFVELESALFETASLLCEALKNSDDISGTLKTRAFSGISRSHLVAFQVGCVFSAIIARKRYFRWGGIVFIDFDQAANGIDGTSKDAQIAVISALNSAITYTAAEDIGTQKLGPVFRHNEKNSTQVGFLEYLNFNCIMRSKSNNWEKSLSDIIGKTDKNSYYLFAILNSMMNHLQNEIMSGRDRDHLKRLVAIVSAKRSFNKQTPGAKAVKTMLDHLEKNNHFDGAAEDSAISISAFTSSDPEEKL